MFSKQASGQREMRDMMLYLLLEFVVLGVYAVAWQQILKFFPLTVAMSYKGVTLIFSMLWAVVIFHEQITAGNIIGTLLIMAGIGMVSQDE